MAINYNKYINSTGTHYIANSGSDERGKYNSGAAGDQTGKEFQLRSFYSRPWSHVFRHPDPQVRRLIAELAIEAALNDNIGYDQYQRMSFYNQLKVSGYRPANITVKCEEDCSAGVNSIVNAVGHLLNIEALKNVDPSNTSRNTKAGLKAAGFQVLTDKKYLTSGKYLLPGDILLYENHHVATNITKGAKAEDDVASNVNAGTVKEPTLGDRILKNGMSGTDVKELQKLLIGLGYSCGPDGADGDFGDNTKKAVKKFQKAAGVDVDGEVGPNTLKALKAAAPSTEKTVTISGGNCNVRATPSTDGKILGVAKNGSTFKYVGTAENGWNMIDYNGVTAYVSNKYSSVK